MSADPEINVWRAEWVSLAFDDKGTVANIRERAATQQFRLRAWHIVELMSALFFLIFSAALLWRHPAVEVALWFTVVWVSTLTATAFSLWNWRILWKANLQSVAEYTTAYEKRCFATLRGVRFGLRFLAVQMAIGVPWLITGFIRGRIELLRLLASLAFLACWALGFLFLAEHHRRVASTELNELRFSRQTPSE
ncbi:MAG: hypothetical protein JOY62_15585 [Acidobacteriaceae bacterium]|nr:hypothetical protein [Acidobacteriaceae bacterium]MBV9781386.1 hypothetical protein [Acidobacteriaceae bacterium]